MMSHLVNMPDLNLYAAVALQLKRSLARLPVTQSQEKMEVLEVLECLSLVCAI